MINKTINTWRVTGTGERGIEIKEKIESRYCEKGGEHYSSSLGKCSRDFFQQDQDFPSIKCPKNYNLYRSQFSLYRFLNLDLLLLVFIFLSRPEKPAQSILSSSRYYVDMHVMHALADLVVDSQKCPIWFHGLPDSRGQSLTVRK